MSSGRGGWRPAATSLAALALRSATLLAIVGLTGPGALQQAFDDRFRPAWLAVVAAAEVATIPAYVLVYRGVARLEPSLRLSRATAVRVVLAGFGPLAASGGFGTDREMLQLLGEGEATARMRVGAVSTLEWAVLGPITWAAAVVALAASPPLSVSTTWPWVIGVPAAVAVASWATGDARAGRLATVRGRRITFLANVLGGVASVRAMASRPRRFAGAWGGAAGYWVAELAAFYAATRTAGLRTGVAPSVLAYGTGYLASRRSLPLAGAGLVDALLVYGLWSLHQPLAPAVVAVLAYRVFNLRLVVVPALLAHRGLRREVPGGP